MQLPVHTVHAVVLAGVLFVGRGACASEPIPLLELPGTVLDQGRIDYARLPRLPAMLTVIRPAALDPRSSGVDRIDMHHVKFQLHSYLAHHADRFWCIWSEGPPIEDEPTQEVRFATSKDGTVWSPSKSVTGRPEAPYAFIARGLWVRDGKLLALAAHFKGKGAFGADKELELRAYAWDAERDEWRFEAKLYDNAINNFPPQRLPSGEWIVTRRDARFNVSVLVGGKNSLSDWQAFPVVRRGEVEGFSPDEPIFWPLSDDSLFALYRDNSGSQRLFHSTSNDLGRTWTLPQKTNFPNATSKLFSLRTRRGDRVLISNANPELGRRQLHLSVSRDSRVFRRMAVLEVPTPPTVPELSRIALKFRSGVASLQYPHAIEFDRQLLIVISRGKKQIELLRVSMDAVDALAESQ